MAKSAQGQQTPSSDAPRISAETYCSMHKMNKLSSAIFKKYVGSFGTGSLHTEPEWDDLKKELYKK